MQRLVHYRAKIGTLIKKPSAPKLHELMNFWIVFRNDFSISLYFRMIWVNLLAYLHTQRFNDAIRKNMGHISSNTNEWSRHIDTKVYNLTPFDATI